MAQEAPALFDLPDEELERRRQALSYAVIWGNVETSPDLAEIERELDRRARMREDERRQQMAAARDEAWQKFTEHQSRHQDAEQALQAAEAEARRQAERRHQEEQDRLRAEEERARAEQERIRAEEEARLKAEEEARLKANQERLHLEQELRDLAKEQLKTAKLLDFGTGRIVELAQSFVEREDAMHALASALGDTDADATADDLDRFNQAQTLLGAILRSRLSAIPELRMQPTTGLQPNGEKTNGKRPSLEGRTKSILEDLLAPPDDQD